MPNIDLSILNQRQTPAFFADTLANRPAAGFLGRIFVSTDTFAFYRDNGTGWDLIGGPGTGTITGTGTTNTFTIFTGANSIGDSSYLTQSTNIINVDNSDIYLPANNVSSGTNYGIRQVMATNDYWKIYGNTQSSIDNGELVFEIGDNSSSGASDRFRFTINDGALPTDKDLLTLDFDESNLNTNLYVSSGNSVGLGTNTPGAVLDVHSGVNIIQQLNQTIATNNSLLAFQNSGTGLWRIGNFYNSGANDWGIFDIVGAEQPFTIKKTTGQTFIGAQTSSSGRLVVNNATGDNHIVVIGATAPSLRINNAGSGATRQIGIGLATTTNNFIQGTTGGEMAIFNSSTTASPILFGVYDAGTSNTQEAARISAARNFIIGSTTDNGNKLQVTGAGTFTTTLTGVGGVYSGNGLSATVMGGTNATATGLNDKDLTLSAWYPTSGTNEYGGDLYLSAGRPTGGGSGKYGNVYIQAGIGNSTSSVAGSVGTVISASNTLLQFFTAISAINSPVERLRIDNNGNIGIDTTTPNSNANRTLQLHNASSGSTYFKISNNTSGSGINDGLDIGEINNDAYFINRENGFITFWTNAIQRMTIKATGVINISGIPTSAAGLVSGDIYSNLGVLTIVP